MALDNTTDDKGNNNNPEQLSNKAHRGLLFFTVASTDVTCHDDSNGTGTVTSFLNGVPPYTYQWEDQSGDPLSGETDSIITGLAPGLVYSVYVEDSDSPKKWNRLYIFIANPPPIDVGVSKTDISCKGFNDGQISITVDDGGVPPFIYSIDSGKVGTYQPGSIFSGLSPNDYYAVVEDDSGCVGYYSSNPVTIIEPDTLEITLDDSSSLTCFESADGFIETTISGGTTPYNITWDGPDPDPPSAANIYTLVAGPYDLSVKDKNNCAATLPTLTLTQPQPIIISLVDVQDASCNGSADGSIDVSVTGGIQPYTLVWSGPAGPYPATENLSGLIAGDYSLLVTDFNTCTENSGTITVGQPNPLVISIDSVVHISCNGQIDGAIYVSTIGGNPGYTYDWTGPGIITKTLKDQISLSQGDYKTVVSDTKGCKDSIPLTTINEPSAIVITDGPITQVSCFGGSDGTIDVNIAGGTAPFIYSWVGPVPFTATTKPITGLSVGTYTLTVTDSRGCQEVHVVNLTEPPLLVITVDSVNDVTCNGLDDGDIYTTITGGTPVYNLTWTGPGGPPATADIEDLQPGTYKLDITDAKGCPATTGDIQVDQPNPLVITLDSTIHISCNGLTDGAIYVTTIGGNPVYTYKWTGPGIITQTLEDQTALSQGDYKTVVTDTKGCKDSIPLTTINEPSAIVITDGPITQVSCFGGSDGTIDVNIAGGTAPFIYSWIGPVPFTATTKPITGLSVGTYTLTVTDSRGCQEVHVVNLTEPPLLVITVDSVNDISCNGLVDGDIYTTITGGTPAYNLTWTGPGGPPATADIEDLQPGTYKLDITDAKGCPATTGDIQVNQPNPLVITLDSTIHISCNGLTDGAIYVTTIGGNPVYTYKWTGPGIITQTLEDQTALSQGDYKTVVTDTKGCKDSIPLTTINEPSAIVITDGPITQVSCFGGSDGTIDVNIAGGTATFHL